MIFQYFWIALAILVVGFVVSMFRILREYERGVIFMLGRYHKVKGPGLILVIPVIQQMVKVDLRVRVLDVPSQDVISRDNVSVKVNAVLYFRVVDPERAVINVEDFYDATSQLSQTTLRSVLGKHELDEMLASRDELNRDIQEILDEQTDPWGIKVVNVGAEDLVEGDRKLPHVRQRFALQMRPFLTPGAALAGPRLGANGCSTSLGLSGIAGDQTRVLSLSPS